MKSRLDWPQADCRVAEKKALTHALLERARRACAASDIRCTVLMLPHQAGYQAPPDWRAEAITAATQSQGLTLVDAGQVWTEAGLGAHDVYAPDQHPTIRANAALGRALAQTLAGASD